MYLIFVKFYQLKQELQLENEKGDESQTETEKEKTSTDNNTENNTEKPEPRLPEVKLPDSDPHAFELVLSYIYTDRIHPAKHSKSSKC